MAFNRPCAKKMVHRKLLMYKNGMHNDKINMVFTFIDPYFPEVMPSITGPQQILSIKATKAATIISILTNNFKSFTLKLVC